MSFFDQYRGDRAAPPPAPVWGSDPNQQGKPNFSSNNYNPSQNTPASGPPVYSSAYPSAQSGTSTYRPPPAPVYSGDNPLGFSSFQARPEASNQPSPMQLSAQPNHFAPAQQPQYQQHQQPQYQQPQYQQHQQPQYQQPQQVQQPSFFGPTESSIMYTKQVVLEKFGRGQVSELPQVRPKLDKLGQITAEFEGLLTISKKVAINFRNMRESQKDMGDFLKNAAANEKENVKDLLFELGSAFLVAFQNGEEVLNCLQRLEDTAITFRKAAIQDAYASSEKYERARIAYDATRQKVSEMQQTNLDQGTLRQAQIDLESKRCLFQQFGSDLTVKMILLTEKRIQTLASRIQDYLSVNRKYYAACAKIFSSIKANAMKTESYNIYAFKAPSQLKSGNSGLFGSAQQDANWEELKQNSLRQTEQAQAYDAQVMSQLPQQYHPQGDLVEPVQAPSSPYSPNVSRPFSPTSQIQTPSSPISSASSPNSHPKPMFIQPSTTPPPTFSQSSSPAFASSPKPAQFSQPSSPTVARPAIPSANQSSTPPPQWDAPAPVTGVVLSRGGASSPLPPDLDF